MMRQHPLGGAAVYDTIGGDMPEPIMFPAGGAPLPKYRVVWPCVNIKTQRGTVDLHYPEINPLIPWISDEQAQQLLAYGAIERINTPATEPAADLEPSDRGPTQACIAAMDTLGLPVDCGSPTARDALRNAGHHFGNDTIADAVKSRKANQPKGT